MPLPTQITGLAGVTAVAAGDDHSLALLADGSVDAWGFDFSGQLGNGEATLTPGCFCLSSPTAVPHLGGVSGIAADPEPGAVTTNASVLESDPSGFWICTVRFPADCRSAAASEVVHCVLEGQDVVREEAATRIDDPGPGEVMSTERIRRSAPMRRRVLASRRNAGARWRRAAVAGRLGPPKKPAMTIRPP